MSYDKLSESAWVFSQADLDNHYMQIALNTAKAAFGQTSPNPCVGAVIVKNNTILAIGAHLQSGSHHAEVNAINQVNTDELSNSTLYITLEPCCHTNKKTPPCTSLIIKSGIKRVVIATLDPNPNVNGKGIKQLEKSGIEVTTGILQKQAIELNKIFFYYIQNNLPYITLKAGISLDGKVATETLESKWITSKEARQDSHYYRHTYDAILVGINTVLQDNPSLTTRIVNGGRNPIRIVLDSTLKIPLTSNILCDRQAPTLIFTTKKAANSKIKAIKQALTQNMKHNKLVVLEKDQIELPEVLTIIAKMGISSILVEGGANIIGSFIKQKLFNQLVLYISPTLIGGINAPSFFGSIKGFEQLSQTPKLKIESTSMIGECLKLVAQH